MNRHCFSLFRLTAICIFAGGSVLSSRAHAAPTIKADAATHDFGKTFTGLQLRHSFEIRNAGNADLIISRIDFDAGCYQVEDYPATIAPGKTISLKLGVDARKVEGAFMRVANVLSNDPDLPRLSLRMTGDCKPPVELDPPFAGFGKIIDGKVKETSVAIRNKTSEKFRVTLVSDEDELYTYKLTEIKPDKEYRLDVKTKTPLVQGRLESIALLNTTLEAQPELQIKAFAYVPPRLEVIPNFIMWDPASLKTPDAQFSTVVLFSNNGDRQVKVSGVSIDDEDIKLTVSPIMEGKSYRILVQAPPKYVLSEMGKTLTITTDDNFFPTIRIPVRPAPSSGQLPAVDESGKQLTIDRLVGRTVPQFNLTTVEGIGIRNANLSDAITLLNFFAPGDRNNFQQLLKLEGVRRVYAERGIRFVNICEKSELTDVTQDRQLEIMQNAELKSELVFDLGNEVGESFRLLIYPTLVVVNKAGVIESILEGNEDNFLDTLTKQLDTLLTGRPLANKLPDAPPPTPAAPGLTGKTCPDFTLHLAGNRTFSRSDISSYAATVLNFVAVDSAECRRQIPVVETAAAGYGPKNVRFLHINQSIDVPLSADECAKRMSALNATTPTAHDPENTMSQLFHISSYPTLVIIRRDGTIFDVVTGSSGKLEDVLPPRIEEAIKSAKYDG